MSSKEETPRDNKKIHKNRIKGLPILKTAESIFAEKGFYEAIIADIAREAHVSEATMYECFGSKKDLLFSIPAEAISQSHQKSKEILEYLVGSAHKLSTLICRHLRIYMDNPDCANVFSLKIEHIQKTTP